MSLNYDFVDMKLFMAVAQEGNVTRGANRVFLSTPAASIRLRNLEAALGVQLFNRKPSGVELTAAGQAFLRHADEILRHSDAIALQMEEFATGAKGLFRLMLNTCAISQLPPSLLYRFLREQPRVNLDVREALSSQIVQHLHNGDADLGIVAQTALKYGLDSRPYQTQRLVLVTPLSHPLATAPVVRLKDLHDVDMIGLTETSALSEFLRVVSEEHGMPLTIRVRVNSFETIASLVSSSLGAAIVPEPMARKYQAFYRLAMLGIDEAWAERRLVVCAPSFEALPVYARQFVDQLQEAGEVAFGAVAAPAGAGEMA